MTKHIFLAAMLLTISACSCAPAKDGDTGSDQEQEEKRVEQMLLREPRVHSRDSSNAPIARGTPLIS